MLADFPHFYGLSRAVLCFLFLQLLFPAFGFRVAAGAGRKLGQRDDEIKIVIRRDTIKAFKAATEAAMYDDVLTIAALKAAYRLHRMLARTRAVSWLPVIDVT